MPKVSDEETTKLHDEAAEAEWEDLRWEDIGLWRVELEHRRLTNEINRG